MLLCKVLRCPCRCVVEPLETVCSRTLHDGIVHDDRYVSVREFYKDKHIFITGSTGFVGQSLVEKLLRSCPDLGRIYIPIRASKKGDANQRYEAFINNTVFDGLRVTNPEFRDKLVPLAASLEETQFGLSKEVFDELTDKVSVIFHVAALIKFNPPLRDAIRSNVLVSANVFQFGEECRHLEAYVHVSSLYSHIDIECVEEKVYPTAWDHRQLIKLNDAKELDKKSKAILGTSPGTYFATKKVGEYLTKQEGGLNPVAIVRPGKVSPSLRYPVPAWSYGQASYIPWMALVEKGDVSFLTGTPEHKEEIIPVDLCANCLVTTAWYIGTGRYQPKQWGEPFVINLHSSRVNYTTEDFVAHVNKCLKESGRSSLVVLDSSRSFYLGAFMIAEKGTYAIQVKNNPKIFKNLEKIDSSLNNIDRKDFSSDIEHVNWEDYIKLWLKTLMEKREAKARIPTRPLRDLRASKL